MAHLANPNEEERWYMYELLPKQGTLTHYVVGKKPLGNKNRKCIIWWGDTIKIVDYEGECKYEGSDMDMERMGGDVEEALKYYMDRNKLEAPIQPEFDTSDFEAVFESAETNGVYTPPNVVMDPYKLGIYGEDHEKRDKSAPHLTTAFATWNETKGADKNPLKVLSRIMENEKNWIENENTPFKYGGGARFFTGFLGLAVVVACSLFGN
jgi:hypothetical protein